MAATVQVRGRWIEVGVLLLLLLAAFVHHLRSDHSYDVWLHVETGEQIIERKALPSVDLYTHTAEGRQWIIHEWLAMVVLYAIYAAGGINTLILFKAAIITLTLLVIYFAAKPHSYISLPIILFLAGFTEFASDARPHIFFWLLLALLFYLLRAKRYWLLIPLSLIWANTHGSIVLALAIIACWLGYDLLEQAWREKSLRAIAKEKKKLIQIASCFLAAVINPSGIEMLFFPFRVLTTAATKTLLEWKPFEWGTVYLNQYAAFIAIGVVVLIIARKQISPRDIILFIGFAAFGFLARRNTIPAAIALAAIVGAAGHHTLRTVPGRYAKHGKAAVILITLLLTIPFLISSAKGISFGIDKRYYPIGIADFLEQNHLEGNMFNSYTAGNYLIWRLYPDYKVFIDGKADLLYPEIYADYAFIMKAWPGFEELIGRYNVSYFVVKHREGINQYLSQSPEWDLIYFDEIGAIYVKADDPRYTQFRRFTAIDPYFDVPNKDTQKEIAELEYLTTLAPAFAGPNRKLAYLYAQQGDYHKALAALSRYLELSGGTVKEEDKELLERLRELTA